MPSSHHLIGIADLAIGQSVNPGVDRLEGEPESQVVNQTSDSGNEHALPFSISVQDRDPNLAGQHLIQPIMRVFADRGDLE